MADELTVERPSLPIHAARVPMRVVYIAGPFRAASAWDRECHIRRAESLALAVWRMGAAALCPHTNTRFFQDAAPDAVWLAGAIALMLRCDAMLLVPGWEQSTGATHERTMAQNMGMPVFEDLDVLRAWIQARQERTRG